MLQGDKGTSVHLLVRVPDAEPARPQRDPQPVAQPIAGRSTRAASRHGVFHRTA